MDDWNEDQWDRMIQGLRDGDDQACTDFWNQFGGRLQAVAQNQISDRLRRRVGSDDVVQSACRTFFRRISAGQFDLPDADALWRLMCAITLTKARRAARNHSRQKRGMNAEQYLDAGTDSTGGMPELSGGQPTPLDAAMFSDQLDSLLAGLSPQECEILDLKLQSHTNDEIAAQLGCSERTVRRVTQAIRTRWTALFDNDEALPGQSSPDGDS